MLIFNSFKKKETVCMKRGGKYKEARPSPGQGPGKENKRKRMKSPGSHCWTGIGTSSVGK